MEAQSLNKPIQSQRRKYTLFSFSLQETYVYICTRVNTYLPVFVWKMNKHMSSYVSVCIGSCIDIEVQFEVQVNFLFICCIRAVGVDDTRSAFHPKIALWDSCSVGGSAVALLSFLRACGEIYAWICFS